VINDMNDIVPWVLSVGLAVLVFLAIRNIILWYWRINEIADNQKRIVTLLSTIVDQNRIFMGELSMDDTIEQNAEDSRGKWTGKIRRKTEKRNSG